MSEWIYRIGLGESEVREENLKRAGLVYTKVTPREKFLAAIISAVGKPYKWGASVLKDAPHSFDCSSLTAWASVEAGFSIPRIAIDQYVYSQKIQRADLKPGDLIFVNTGQVIHSEGQHYSQVLGTFVKEVPIRTKSLEYLPGTEVSGGIDHLFVYIDDDTVIHASGAKGSVVKESAGANPFMKNIVGYGRVITDERERFVVEIPTGKPELRKKENLLQFLA